MRAAWRIFTRFGIHSITNLASGGVHPKTAQSLARHSDITLTMNRYSHSYRDQEIDALRTLPDLSNPARERLSATGTDGAAADDSHSADYLAQNQRRGASDVGAGGRSKRDPNSQETHQGIERTPRNDTSGREESKPPNGFEPLTCGLQNRCSTN